MNVDGLSADQKRALLGALAGRPWDSEVEFPLSYEQAAIWFVYSMSPDTEVLNLGDVLSIKGELDVPALEHALNKVIERHELLRAVFLNRDGTPMQKIRPECTAKIECVDATETPWPSLLETVTADLRHPFDLGADLMIRLRVYRRSPTEHLAVLVMHHIVSDFVSQIVVLKDLGRFYQCHVKGHQTPPFAPPANYAQYVARQRRLLGSEGVSKLVEFWKAELHPPLPILPHLLGRPRGIDPSMSGAYFGRPMRHGLRERVSEAQRQIGVTAFSFYHAAYLIMLRRYSKQQDIVVGCPTSFRTRAEFSETVGMFVNEIPIRVSMDDRAPFSALAEDVNRKIAAALDDNALPFAFIVEKVQPRREAGRAPVFDASFTYRSSRLENDLGNVSATALGHAGVKISLAPGLAGETLPIPQTGSQYDITLVVSETPDCIYISWEYRTSLYNEQEIARMTEHFEQLVASAAADHSLETGRLAMASDAEKQAAFVLWNQSDVALPFRALLHRPFEEQVAKNSEGVAISQGHRNVSYQTLDIMAENVCARIIQCGRSLDVPVAILIPKGIDQVCAVLGILKAGGIFMPVDTCLPATRIAEMLRLGRCELALTSGGEEAVGMNLGCECLSVSDCMVELEPMHTAAIRPRTPADAAYVIFTSGSTGTPKGVVISHQSALNTVLDINLRFGVHAGDRVLGLSPLSFDLSIYDIFGTFAVGGTLVFPEEAGLFDPVHWAVVARTHAVTIWNSTPAQVGLFVDHLPHGQLPDRLRLILISGDWISVALPSRIKRYFPSARIISLGGATECAIWSIYYPIETLDPEWRSVPYGRPLGNQHVYVLDEFDNPCPPGVIGEICIGGAGVAIGYWDDTARTDERFCHHVDLGERLYRTGDSGRYFADGAVELIGRMDRQLKVRGFRVEPGEIESKLRDHPAVRECKVFGDKSNGDTTRLIAALVARDVTDTDAIRHHLSERLPAYMVPQLIVIVDAWPLTANGKIDTKALVAIAESSRIRVDSLLTASSATATILHNAYREVLDFGEIDHHANFHSLGGDSVGAIRVVAKLTRLGYSLSLRDFHANPSVSQLARWLDRVQPNGPGFVNEQARYRPSVGSGPSLPGWEEQQTRAVLANRPGIVDIYPLASMQETMLLHSLASHDCSLYVQQVLLEFTGELDAKAMLGAWQQAIDSTPALRSGFLWKFPPHPVRFVVETCVLDHLVVDLSKDAALDKAARFTTQLARERALGFDLTDPPLLRLTIFKFSADAWTVAVTHHHLLLDGWSLNLVIHRVAEHYRGGCDGQDTLRASTSVPRYPPPILTEDQGQSADFWLRRLNNVLPSTRRADWKNPSEPGRFGVLDVPIEHDTVAASRDLIRRLRVTMNDLMQSVCAITIGRYHGNDQPLLGVTVAGRHSSMPGVDELIGMFINTLPVAVHVNCADSFSAWLQEQHKNNLSMRAHEHANIAEILRSAGLTKSGTVQHLYDAVLVYANYPLESAAWCFGDGLELQRFDFIEWTGNPLTLYILPDDGRLQLRLVHDEVNLTEVDARQVAELFVEVLKQVLATPDCAVGQIAPRSSGTAPRLAELRGDATSGPTATLHALFERQVDLAPQASALVDGDDVIDYAELNRRANQVAHHLLDIGVRPGSLVGVVASQSPRLFVGLVAILKAGAAYVPIDPTFPTERVRLILAGAGIRVLLTFTELGRLPAAQGIREVLLDVPGAFDQYPASNPAPVGHPSGLAYVIYTSGTTGTPKGVAVTHANVANHAAAAIRLWALSPNDRMLQFSTICFDAAVEEIFPTWFSGAALVLRSESVEVPDERFWLFLRDQGITILDLPVGYWDEMTRQLRRSGKRLPPCVRLVIVGGEEPSPQRLVHWMDSAPPQCVSWFNTYGPTEATVIATAYRADGPISGGRIPIGKPLDNVQVYLLDEHGTPVARGAIGEIHIGGLGVCRGYLGQPGATSCAFVPDSFSAVRGSRMFRTGDYGRYLEDGSVEFAGRRDRQIKLRGRRIELDEIELTLRGCDGVLDAAVAAVPADDGPVIVAHVALSPAARSAGAAELKKFLRDRLPTYMMPSKFVTLDILPKTPSGKIDRQTLAQDVDRLARPVGDAGDHEEPLGATEMALRDIWRELLGAQIPDRDSSFFELGGHSLLAARMAARVHQLLNVEIQLRSIFEAPTIRSLAALIDEQVGHQCSRPAASIPRVDRKAMARPNPSLAKSDPDRPRDSEISSPPQEN